MFNRRHRRHFHVNTHRVYIIGEPTAFEKMTRLFHPYTTRSAYRQSGQVIAL